MQLFLAQEMTGSPINGDRSSVGLGVKAAHGIAQYGRVLVCEERCEWQYRVGVEESQRADPVSCGAAQSRPRWSCMDVQT